jgi:hypothetical protein
VGKSQLVERMAANKPKGIRAGRRSPSALAQHPERERIEHDLLKGVPVRVVCRKYGTHKDGCYRFLKDQPVDVKARRFADALHPGIDLEQLRNDESEGLLVGLHTQRMRLLMMQDAALELADAEMVARLSQQIHQNLALVGKYLGEFVNRSQVQVLNLTMTPEYMRLREALLLSMVKHPDARADVLKALKEIELLPAIPSTADTTAAPPFTIEATAEAPIN